MRISDWSLDVCSSDLIAAGLGIAREIERRERVAVDRLGSVDLEIGGQTGAALREVDPRHEDAERLEIGGIRQAEIIVCGVGQCRDRHLADVARSEEHPSELQSLMRSSYAVFRL